MPRKPRTRPVSPFLNSDSDSSSSSSGNESLSSSSSSSVSQSPWSQIGTVTIPKTARYLFRIQQSLFFIVRSLGSIVEEDGNGWLEVRKWIKNVGMLAGRWEWPELDESGVYTCIGIATLYIKSLFKELESDLIQNDKVYTSSLDSESFKAMIVVSKRLWPSLSTRLLFNPPYPIATSAIQQLSKVRASVVTRFFAITLQRPGTVVIDSESRVEWQILDLSNLDGGESALKDLDFELMIDAVHGGRDGKQFLVNLSHNDLHYVPKRFRDFYPRVYAIDLSHNPVVGLPDYFRDRAFDWYFESTLRLSHTPLKDFTRRKRWYPPASVPASASTGLGVQPLGYYATKRIYDSEVDRLNAIQTAHHWQLPPLLLETLQSGYECDQCGRFLTESTLGYMAHAVVQLSPSGLAFGGRKCLDCVGREAGIWPLFTG